MANATKTIYFVTRRASLLHLSETRFSTLLLFDIFSTGYKRATEPPRD
jgi:hypothetical protein